MITLEISFYIWYIHFLIFTEIHKILWKNHGLRLEESLEYQGNPTGIR